MNPEAEQRTVERLRAESAEVKSCFTRYSFQALGLAAASLGAAFVALRYTRLGAATPLPAIAVLMATARMGIFKYTTANRNTGYELHLARTRHMVYETRAGESARWQPHMRGVDWEEAVRAWRIVQASVFERVYVTPRKGYRDGRGPRGIRRFTRRFSWRMYKLSKEASEIALPYQEAPADLDAPGVEYPWFLPRVLAQHAPDTDGRATYHPGSYLRGMLDLLTLAQITMCIPLFLVSGKTASCVLLGGRLASGLACMNSGAGAPDYVAFGGANSGLVESGLAAAVGIVLVVLIVLRYIQLTRRRIVLEEELLSIHSSAILWQAVVACHYRAVAKCGTGYARYTERLAQETCDLADNVYRIHEWLRSVGNGAQATGATAAESGET